MNKNGIKKFAIEARRELLSRVSQRALLYGISEENPGDPAAEAVNGHLLSSAERKERAHLIERIREKGYREVMEEVAYTWFNRFSALRFMEVNGYLPGKIRLFTDESNDCKPQILTEALHLDLEGLDMDQVMAYKEKEDNDGLYKYLLITECNALYSQLPGMFQPIADYTELLFPDNLLREGSVIHRMIQLIPEEDWKDAVQIIGWLYQYYNSEKKDDVFAALKKNVKITRENIPAATQLFTPDWIVRYMVENSLGRLWLEGHEDGKENFLPTKEERDAYAGGDAEGKWYYYLEEAPQEREVEEKLALLRKDYATLDPEEIKVIDPCSGSGHILVYLFDVLMGIYTAYGYNQRDAARSIVAHNLYGLDIDERAAQLSYFAVMMKGRQYDRRFLTSGVQPHVHAIAESNHVDPYTITAFCGDDEKLQAAMGRIVQELHDAKDYGSILTVHTEDWAALRERLTQVAEENGIYAGAVQQDLLPLIDTAEALAQTYDVVVTNPPYMGAGNMSAKLSAFVKKHYPDSKSDLFAVFIERCGQMTKKNAYQAMITQHAWMFLSSFEKLRVKLLATDMVNMAHLGARAFEEIGGEVVQTTSFVLRQSHMTAYKGTYCRLIEPTTQQEKEDMFLAGEHHYIANQGNFSKIPGAPVAYWVSEGLLNAFATAKQLAVVCETRKGLATSDNNRFLKRWFEPDFSNIALSCASNEETKTLTKKWYPLNKGGEFNRWYGNREYVINWKNDGYEIRNFRDANGKLLSRPQNTQYNFQQALTWSKITSGDFSARFSEGSFLFDDAAAICHHKNKTVLLKVLGFLNSKCCQIALAILNPTVNIQIGDIGHLPILSCNDELVVYVEECLALSRADWDAYETSWDFQRHPMVARGRVADAYAAWKGDCESRFQKLKANEEELNRIFIDIYGLQDELTPEVAERDVTVHRIYDSKDDVPESMKGSSYVRTRRDEVVSLISYAVGCMFGRYSLDAPGLAYAGGDWDPSKYVTFPADADAVIPICDDEYFPDDIVGRFVTFVKTVYGEEYLEENLSFLAGALGGKGSARDVLRSYFLNDFYKDHCKTYQKRPIYWLFDSGKKNGFKALVYMHRYGRDTIARIRTDYVHEQQARYRTAITDLENRLDAAAGSEKVKLTKRLKALEDQAAEIHDYEEKIHHLADRMIEIDLDDGVKVNYAKFQDVLAKIK